MTDCILFNVLLENIALMWLRHLCRFRAAKFRHLLGACGLSNWEEVDLYRVPPAGTSVFAVSSEGLPN